MPSIIVFISIFFFIASPETVYQQAEVYATTYSIDWDFDGESMVDTKRYVPTVSGITSDKKPS